MAKKMTKTGHVKAGKKSMGVGPMPKKAGC